MFLVAVALAALAAATGWFVEGFYAEDGATLEARARYGGLVILVVMVPLALVAVVLERRGHTLADPFMLGLVAHLGFMHGVLAFNYRENELFVVYSAMVGLCLLLGVTGLIDFARSVERPQQTLAIRLGSVGLVLAAVIGYGYWISEVVTALHGERVRRLFFWCVGSARLVVWRAGPVVNGVFNHRTHTRRRPVGRRHTAAGTVPNGRLDANQPRRQRNADPPGSRPPCRPGSRLEVHGAGLLAR